MDRLRKIELIQRSLGIRHKLKVHDSMKLPETHEELSLMMLTRWELEDELRAIEEVLGAIRTENVASKRVVLERQGVTVPGPDGKPMKKKAKK